MTVDAPIDFLATGTLFFDLVFQDAPLPGPGHETFARAFAVSPGGSANKAVASARLGQRTTLVSELGDDWAGDLVMSTLAAEPALDLSQVRRRPGGQTAVTAAVSTHHDRSFITYVDPDAATVLPAGLGRVGVADADISGPLPAWARALRDAGTQLYAGAAWDPTGAWDAAVLENLSGVDVFILNEVEALNYARQSSAEAAAEHLGRFVDTVVVTLGPRGSLAYQRAGEGLVHAPGIEVRAIDPTGAGDTFTAAFAASYNTGWALADRLLLANLAAAFSVQGLGGARSAPRPADLLSLMRRATGSALDGELVAAWLHDRLPLPNESHDKKDNEVAP